MKLLFLIVVASLISGVAYVATAISTKSKGKKRKKSNWIPLTIASSVFVVLLGLIGYGVYSAAQQPDMQCASSHTTTTQPPSNLQTATDYFQQGNYDYDTGNCQKAVSDYTKAIQLNPNFAQAYNNRAYTNMRLQNYKDALPDLDKAIALNPNYIQALMNRGDIHNYYYQIDRLAAIADYKKVISLTDASTRRQTSVCGHLFLAKHNGWTLGAFIGYFTGEWASCK